MTFEEWKLQKTIETSFHENPKLKEIMDSYRELTDEQKDVFVAEVYKLLKDKVMN